MGPTNSNRARSSSWPIWPAHGSRLKSRSPLWAPQHRRIARLFPTTSSQIRPTHLERHAFVYVRQATLFQVREHTASTARQYDVAPRAQALGWPRESITVIAQDQGHSGASTADRDGFQGRIAEVGLGHAGAVFSLEVSRLARASSDW